MDEDTQFIARWRYQWLWGIVSSYVMRGKGQPGKIYKTARTAVLRGLVTSSQVGETLAQVDLHQRAFRDGDMHNRYEEINKLLGTL